MMRREMKRSACIFKRNGEDQIETNMKTKKKKKEMDSPNDAR